MPIDFSDYNDAIQSWGNDTRELLKATGRRMGIEHRKYSLSKGESLAKIRTRFGQQAGDINKVSFTNINRSLIYTSVGAGKGRGGRKGSRWIDKYGNRKTTNPASLGKMGTAGRTAKPFIDETLDGPGGLEKLGDIVGEKMADAIVQSVYIK